MTPIFIFSTPRAGSTLLQRILASHKDIATTAEPWLLLPLISMSQQQNHLACYSSAVAAKAINNFTDKVDEKNSYNEQLAGFVLSLYQSVAAGNETFFLDKTPRYYYIIDEIIELFPHAKFIFLFRNPVQVYSSILTTWCKNRFLKLYRNRDDLYLAPKLLANAYEKHQEKSLAINYDDLVSDNDNVSRKIFTYLGIEQGDDFSFDLQSAAFEEGEMGDPTGQNKYKAISQQSINAWREVFNNPVRKWYVKKYVSHLGEKVAAIQGYKVNDLHAKIEALPNETNNTIIKDVVDIIYQRLVYKFKLNLLFSAKHNQKGFFD